MMVRALPLALALIASPLAAERLPALPAELSRGVDIRKIREEAAAPHPGATARVLPYSGGVIVRLKDGGPLEARLLARDERGVTLALETGRVTIPVSEIASIEAAPDPQKAVPLAAVIIRKDGGKVEGMLLDVDSVEKTLIVALPHGRRAFIPHREVAVVKFAREAKPMRPVDVTLWMREGGRLEGRIVEVDRKAGRFALELAHGKVWLEEAAVESAAEGRRRPEPSDKMTRFRLKGGGEVVGRLLEVDARRAEVIVALRRGSVTLKASEIASSEDIP